MMAVSFSSDIAPIFNQFTGQMLWRFDLTNYDQVRANAQVIYGRINTNQMPPPPFDPLTLEQIQLFQQWMDEGYLP